MLVQTRLNMFSAAIAVDCQGKTYNARWPKATGRYCVRTFGRKERLSCDSEDAAGATNRIGRGTVPRSRFLVFDRSLV